jgi:hypothetical protein
LSAKGGKQQQKKREIGDYLESFTFTRPLARMPFASIFKLAAKGVSQSATEKAITSSHRKINSPFYIMRQRLI